MTGSAGLVLQCILTKKIIDQITKITKHEWEHNARANIWIGRDGDTGDKHHPVVRQFLNEILHKAAIFLEKMTACKEIFPTNFDRFIYLFYPFAVIRPFQHSLSAISFLAKMIW